MPKGMGYSMKVDLEPALGEKKTPKIANEPLPKTEPPMSLKQATKKAALSALEKKKKKKGEAAPAENSE